MPDGDSIINNTNQYQYLTPNNQPQKTPYKFDWNNSFIFPIDFTHFSSNKPVPEEKVLPQIKDDKTIGDYLNKGYVCKTDALRVANQAKVLHPNNTVESIEEEKTQIPDIPIKYNTRFDVTKNLYNGSVEDLNRCLKGTKLEGKGQMFLEAQEKYGINALFLMSIVKNESGFGNAPAKERNGTVHKYNIAGLKTGKRIPGHIYQDNESYEACIESLCKNLHKHYIDRGKTTIGNIQVIYAPGNKAWANKVTNNMDSISTTIMRPYLADKVDEKKSNNPKS